ncbi:unnamed protein product [Mesocestoides corti]|uniref:Secreted protein n=1 Tax=Mesocestoides corti TaxID=53468 RepID=A0A0R3UQ76_MESCO|nr:unnamed protein product [Mesocestoides corti]
MPKWFQRLPLRFHIRRVGSWKCPGVGPELAALPSHLVNNGHVGIDKLPHKTVMTECGNRWNSTRTLIFQRIQQLVCFGESPSCSLT